MSGKKKTIIIVALLMVVFIGSISYALWSVTLEQTDSNVLKTGCFEVGLIENTDEINLPEEYPVTDEKGRSYSPFTFTIQNTCTVDSSYSVNLKVMDGTTLDVNYLKTVLNTDMAQVLTAYDEVDTDKYQLTTGTLRGASAEGAGDGQKVTYDLRLWLDQDTPKTQMSKDFYGKIVIENITTTIEEETSNDLTGKLSDASYTLSKDGSLAISGTGAVSTTSTAGIMGQIISDAIANDTTVTAEEKAIMETDSAVYVVAAVQGDYAMGVDAAKTANNVIDTTVCPTTPTSLEEYNTCLTAIGITDANLTTLMEKAVSAVPTVKEITIAEGITELDGLTNLTNVAISIPASVTTIADAAFENSTSLTLNFAVAETAKPAGYDTAVATHADFTINWAA